jgi:hypothetical protein
MFNLICKMFCTFFTLLFITSFSHAEWVSDGTIETYIDGDSSGGTNSGYRSGTYTFWGGTTPLTVGYGWDMYGIAHHVLLTQQQAGTAAGYPQSSVSHHMKSCRKTFTWYTSNSPTDVNVKLQGICTGSASINTAGGTANASVQTHLAIVSGGGTLIDGSLSDVNKSCTTTTLTPKSISGTALATIKCVQYSVSNWPWTTTKCKVEYQQGVYAGGGKQQSSAGAYNTTVDLQAAVGNWNI